MHQTDHERNSDASLNGALDRVQMTPSDRIRAKAEMIRAQFIANVVLKSINGLQDAIRLAPGLFKVGSKSRRAPLDKR